MPQVRANGIDITYEETGSGEPLVLVHGGHTDRHNFDLFRPLLGEGIRASAYDQRDSPDTPGGAVEGYGMRDHADDCAAFIEALGLGRAHVMGESYGGMVAMVTAIHHPERVKSLILASTSPSYALTGPAGDETGVAPGSDEIESFLHEAKGPDEIQEFLIGLTLTPDAVENDPTLVADFNAAMRVREPEAIGRRMAAVFAHDCVADLGRIQAPTLVLNGTDDPITTPQTAAFTAQRIPGAELHMLPGYRHGLTLMGRVRTASVVREFVLAHATA